MKFKDLRTGALFRKLSWETGYFEVKIEDKVEDGILFNCASVDRLGFYGHTELYAEVQKGKVVLDE